MHRSAVAEASKFMDNLNFTYVGMVDFLFLLFAQSYNWQ